MVQAVREKSAVQSGLPAVLQRPTNRDCWSASHLARCTRWARRKLLAGAALSLVQEGFRTHRHTELVESPEEAELIVWVVTASDHQVQLLNEKPPPPLEKPVIVLDYSKT